MKRRVEEELEKRRDEIELEVVRRVEAAKIQMEQEMMIELEKRRENAREEERMREVNIAHSISSLLTSNMIWWLAPHCHRQKGFYRWHCHNADPIHIEHSHMNINSNSIVIELKLKRKV